MSQHQLVYDPVAPCLTQPQETRRTLDTLAGKTVAFLDNAKPNFNLLVEDLSRLLVEKHGVKSIVKHRKRSASEGAQETDLQALVEQADAVIAGSGD